MIINAQNLELAYKGFSAKYNEGKLAAPSHWSKIAMKMPSSSRDENYSWLGAFPNLRKWIGQRHVKNLKAHGFTILNEKFESTIEVNRDDIADDKIGIYGPLFSEMGGVAARHPDELCFGLLKDGFDVECFDGQPFFDADHPVEMTEGNVVSVSNLQAGAGAPWFLMDTTREIKPLIFQEREQYTFNAVNDPNHEHVFRNDTFLFGCRARVNAGFGLWQLAFASKATLNAENYSAARAAMMGFKADGDRLLGITPNLLVVPPSLEDAARRLLNTENGTGGESNPWKGSAELLVVPWLA